MRRLRLFLLETLLNYNCKIFFKQAATTRWQLAIGLDIGACRNSPVAQVYGRRRSLQNMMKLGILVNPSLKDHSLLQGNKAMDLTIHDELTKKRNLKNESLTVNQKLTTLATLQTTCINNLGESKISIKQSLENSRLENSIKTEARNLNTNLKFVQKLTLKNDLRLRLHQKSLEPKKNVLNLENKIIQNNLRRMANTINLVLHKENIICKDEIVYKDDFLVCKEIKPITEDDVTMEISRYFFEPAERKLLITNNLSQIDLESIKDPKLQIKLNLINAVSSSLICGPNMKNTRDTTRQTIIKRASDVAEIDPEFILKVAIYTRLNLNIRSTANLLLAFAASNMKCRLYFEKYYNRSIRLPSDWLDVADQYQVFAEELSLSQSLPAVLRRSMVSKFTEFDEYQLAKYNKERSMKKKKKKLTGGKQFVQASTEHSEQQQEQQPTYASKVIGENADDEKESDNKKNFTIKHLIRQLHISKPAYYVMAILGKKYPKNLAEFWSCGLSGMWDEDQSGKRMKLAIPETWETQLSLNGNKSSTWHKLIGDKKLPFMAMLRNLRNIIIARVRETDHQEILRILTDERAVIQSRQFPFRFLSAFQVLEELENRLSGKVGHLTRGKIIPQKWIRKSKNLNCYDTKFIIGRYREALNKSIEISTLYNIPPTKGNSIILCDVSGKMMAPCMNGPKGLGSSTQLRSVALLLGLMCQYTCENSQLILVKDKDHVVITKSSEKSILSRHESLRRKHFKSESDEEENPFETTIQDDLLKKRVQMDNLIILTNSDEIGEKTLNFLRNYRILINPNLLYVQVDLSKPKAKIDSTIPCGHPNNILLCGFSDQLLRFVAERGSSEQLQQIENIDQKYNLNAIKNKEKIEEINKDSHPTPYIKAPKWRTIRVFISSTFRDMHGERDLFLRTVFPQLRARALQLCLDVHDIDLRWGITEQEAEDHKTMEICLQEASRCDFFLGLLGSRYGTVVNLDDIPDSPEFNWIRQEGKGSSITELEFHVGALRRSDFPRERILICIRDNSFINHVPAEFSSEFLPESEENYKRLEKLKSKVKAAQIQLIDNYPCKWNGVTNGVAAVSSLDRLSELTLNTLWNSLQLLYSHEEDDEDSAVSLHENFAIHQYESFCGRKKILLQCMKAINEGNDLIIVSGKTGSGKTALMSAVCVELMKNSHFVVIPYFVDAVQVAKSLDGLISHLHSKLRLNIPAKNGGSPTAIDVQQMLNSASKCAKKVVIVLDGIDKVSSESFFWIPDPVPKNVHLVCSITDTSAAMKNVWRRNVCHIRLLPLNFQERSLLVENILLPYRKKLSQSAFDNQLNTLISKNEANRPLFLNLACQQLRLVWLYENVSEIIRKMPNSVSGLLTHIILETEKHFGSTLVLGALRFLLLTEEGLFEEELYEILNLWLCSSKVKNADYVTMLSLKKTNILPRSHFAKFSQCLKTFLLCLTTNTKEMMLKLTNQEIVSAANARCKHLTDTASFHKCFAFYYLLQADPTENGNWLGKNPRGFKYLIFSLVSAQFVKEAAQIITDLKFLYAKSNIGLCHSILDDFLLVRNEIEQIVDDSNVWKDKLDSYHQFINRYNRTLVDAPSNIFQLALNEPTSSPLYDDARSLQSSGSLLPIIQWLNKPQGTDGCVFSWTSLTNEVICLTSRKNLAAVGLANGEIKLIDLSTTKVIRNIVAHASGVSCLAFFNDNLLVSGSEQSLSLWDLETGNRLATYEGHHRKVTACGFTQDGNLMVSVSWDRTIRIWDLKSARQISVCKENEPINCCVFHPNRNLVAVGVWDGTLRIWDLVSLKRIAILRGHQTSVTSIAHSDCGTYLASSSLDGQIILWSSRHGFKLSSFQASTAKICQIGFNGNNLWSVDDNRAVKVWSSLLSDTSCLIPKLSPCKVMYLASSRKNTKYVIVVYDDSTIVQVNRETRAVGFSIKPSSSRITCVHYDTYLYVAYYNDNIQMLDAETGKLVQSLENDSSVTITAMCCAQDKVVVGYGDGSLCVYSERKKVETKAHYDVITFLAAHPSRQFYASVSRDKSLKVWTGQNKLVAQVDNCHFDWITCCAWIGQNEKTTLVTASNDNSVKLWDVNRNTSLCELVKVLGFMSGPAIFVDVWENRVVCGASNGNIKMFNLQGAHVMSTTVEPTSHFVSCFDRDEEKSIDWYEEVMNEESTVVNKEIAWPSGCLISVTKSEIQTTKLFGTNKLKILSGHSNCVRALTVLDNGMVLTGSSDTTIRKWNDDESTEYESNSSEICCISRNEKGNFIVCSRDGSIVLWKRNELDANLEFNSVSKYKVECERLTTSCFVRENSFVVATDDGLITLLQTDENNNISPHGTMQCSNEIVSATYNKDNDHLYLGRIDGSVSVSEASAGKFKQLVNISSGEWVVDIHYDKNKLFTLDTSGNVTVHFLDKETEKYRLNDVQLCRIERQENVIPFCLTKHKEFVYVGFSDGFVSKRGANESRIRLHAGAVKSCIVDETGNYLITASHDCLVKVWQLENDFNIGSEIAQFECSAPINVLSVITSIIVCGDIHGKIYFLKLLK